MADNTAFVKSLDAATKRIIVDVTENMRSACTAVERDAKKNCPVDMGILRASINSDVALEESQIIGRIGSSLEYAPYVHNGTGIYAVDGNGRKTPWGYEVKSGKYKGFHWTRGQRPQPFLQNSVIKNKAVIERLLGGGG